MKLLYQLKAKTAKALAVVRKKLSRRHRTGKGTSFQKTGITAQDLWFQNFSIHPPKALRAGEGRARKRLAEKLKANESIPTIPREPSRQVRRRLELLSRKHSSVKG